MVLLIMAVLLGLAFTASRQAIAQSRAGKCAANLRQIGVLASLYAGDHNNQLVPWVVAPVPPEKGPIRLWFHYLLNYGGMPGDWRASGSLWDEADTTGKGVDLFKCPAQKDPFKLNYRLRYGINPTHAGLSVLRIQNPSQAIFVADSMDSQSDGVPFSGKPTDARGSLIGDNMANPVSDRHLGGSNVLFVDGHVERFPFNEIATLPSDTPAEKIRKRSRWDQRSN